jgi:DNA gyrase/topoisomerase IV subunit B
MSRRRAFTTWVYEVVDNSMTKPWQVFCDHIKVEIHIDGSVTVEDNGRGIPVDLHEKENFRRSRWGDDQAACRREIR